MWLRIRPARLQAAELRGGFYAGQAAQADLRLLQDVLQTGGVDFGQHNEVAVHGSVLGTVNLQFESAGQVSFGRSSGPKETAILIANLGEISGAEHLGGDGRGGISIGNLNPALKI